MTPEEKSISRKELKQVKAFCKALREQNENIGNELAGMVRKIGKIREAQLSIDSILNEFEAKLKEDPK